MCGSQCKSSGSRGDSGNVPCPSISSLTLTTGLAISQVTYGSTYSVIVLQLLHAMAKCRLCPSACSTDFAHAAPPTYVPKNLEEIDSIQSNISAPHGQRPAKELLVHDAAPLRLTLLVSEMHVNSCRFG